MNQVHNITFNSHPLNDRDVIVVVNDHQIKVIENDGKDTYTIKLNRSECRKLLSHLNEFLPPVEVASENENGKNKPSLMERMRNSIIKDRDI